MVISGTNKMFLLTFALFVLCLIMFVVLVSLRKSEKTLQWDNFIQRGQSRKTDSGETNHWYFVIRDLDKIKALADIRNIERVAHLEVTPAGFTVHGMDYEIVFDRVPASVVVDLRNQSKKNPEMLEDYTLALVKRKLYPWDMKPQHSIDNG
ncbi:uncharacterized protein LOC131432496 [Malaya genurostris]|uniref:uncharacterized protein LOC131432496 n=1 Tax=Malaya genurostris TaxID=325434 RepID=UPI0026F3A4AC|nr:uncharacterized protein LOC131432496 [Malaya genurostris]XP_058454791.1 uncharacterized protein LOC131432496 [Malaya genurostris]